MPQRPRRTPPPRAQAPTSRPTRERTSHAEAITLPDMDGVALRPFWRVETRLDALLADRMIDRPAHDAACKLRADWHKAAAVAGSAWQSERLGGASGQDHHGAALGRTEAVKRLRSVQRRLGTVLFELVRMVVVEDASWAALGERFGVSPKTVKRWAADAINALPVRSGPASSDCGADCG
jgi:hypothetical protein